MNHELSSIVDARIAAATPPDVDPAPKPDDRDDERDRRHRALGALRGAVKVEAEAREATVAATAARAETAVWTGASLADLAVITGHSRQAARKRWPDLGPVSRRRRWLGHHVDDVLWATDLVVTHAAELPADVVAGLREEVAGLHRAFSRPVLDDGSGSARDADDAADPSLRWRALDALVDCRLRAVAGVSAPLPEAAEFCRHGADGVVRYYDHATADESGEAENLTQL